MNDLKNKTYSQKRCWLTLNRIRPLCILLSIFIFLNLVPNSPAAVVYGATNRQQQASEYKIKAVYLYNFILFVEWPKPAEDAKEKKEFILGIIGKDPFGKSFREVENRIIKPKGKKLVIKRLSAYHKKIDLEKCDMLFICRSERHNINKILSRLKGRPVLTTADTKGFLEKGGMINLLKRGKYVKWEINQKPAKGAGLRISSQLLRTAIRVVNTKIKKATNSGATILKAILKNKRAENE
jgi:hypothetical protein